MCGLAGYFSRSGLSDSDAKPIAEEMADRLIHRGPDDAGVWIDEEVGIAIAHRRLSVLDLSPAGKQPMISAFGRYVFAFNGEIYNHLQLRKDLARLDGFTVWRGSSDTETLLAAFESWGIEATLKKTIGMFAIALWDRKERTLTLRAAAKRGAVLPFSGSDVEAVGELESRLKEAIALQRVARHLGTDHTELYVSFREAMETIPKLPLLYDEPFGDSSAIPKYMVSQLAQQHVTGPLSDERWSILA